MATTIQISNDLQDALAKKKIFHKETYEEIIWNLIEDTMEINEQTKKEIEKARAEIRHGKFHTLERVKKELKL